MQNDMHSLAWEGKQVRQPLSTNRGTMATKVLELVHFIVCMPMKNMSIGGKVLVVLFWQHEGQQKSGFPWPKVHIFSLDTY